LSPASHRFVSPDFAGKQKLRRTQLCAEWYDANFRALKHCGKHSGTTWRLCGLHRKRMFALSCTTNVKSQRRCFPMTIHSFADWNGPRFVVPGPAACGAGNKVEELWPFQGVLIARPRREPPAQYWAVRSAEGCAGRILVAIQQHQAETGMLCSKFTTTPLQKVQGPPLVEPVAWLIPVPKASDDVPC
jgi:hypothetical protein